MVDGLVSHFHFDARHQLGALTNQILPLGDGERLRGNRRNVRRPTPLKGELGMEEPSYGQGWFYKQNGERLGPFSGVQLKQLVSSGQLQPRQPVWREGSGRLFFVCAATAVLNAETQALTIGFVG